jgi:hypothetical protein
MNFFYYIFFLFWDSGQYALTLSISQAIDKKDKELIVKSAALLFMRYYKEWIERQLNSSDINRIVLKQGL